jgi:hypothetical protein
LVVVVVAVTAIVHWMTRTASVLRHPDQEMETTAASVARYAIGDFIGACRVRPKPLKDHAYFGSLPIDNFLPDPLSLGRLDRMNVEELVVFCAPAADTELDDRRSAGIEWAAAARASQPIDLAAVMKHWRSSLVPHVEDAEPKPVSIVIENYECFRVPAGSFFAPERRGGDLRFTDRDGTPVEFGINVGSLYGYRAYVEGATNSSAIFTLDHIDEADLVDGHLPLELRLNVFRTYYLEQEYSTAQIELRNPDSGLRSEPITFKAQSYVNHRLKIPRKLNAVKTEGGERVDLIDDLVADGRLEVILKGTDSAIYLGVGQFDLRVRPKAFEYVHVSDREIVVAQSPTTLQKMLRAATSLGSLSQPSGDIVITVKVRDESERIAFRRLLRMIGDKSAVDLLGASITGVTASVSADGPIVARVAAEFKDRRSARTAKTHYDEVIRSAKAQAPASLKNALGRLYASASLLTIGFDGVSMQFPDHEPAAVEARVSQLQSIIDDSLDNVRIKSNRHVLTVEFDEPASLAQLSETAQLAVANIEEIVARDLFSRERFDLGDEMSQRVTDRLPQDARSWFRRAHQLSYNTSVEFDSCRSRYVWVRRGVEVLLDGAEQNADTTDLTWMAARFIGRKVGEADERVAFRRLFSQDEDLHKRIADIIDLENTKSPDNKVDNWLVARLLFEHCIDRRSKSGASSTIAPLLFFSRPAATQARYAHALSESGHWDDARQAWQLAEQMHVELGESTIPAGASERIRLDDLESRLAEFGPDDELARKLQAARRRIQFDYWLMRCRLEQTDEVQMTRKLAQQAAQRVRESELKTALTLYRQSLQVLSDLQTPYPAERPVFAGDFQRLAARYRAVAEQLGETDDQSLAAILALIDQSQPVSSFPLIDLPLYRPEE